MVHTLRVNTETGELMINDTPPLVSRTGTGPRHIAFHPTLPYLYIVLECDLSVETAHYDAATGALTHIQWLPGVEDTFFYAHKGNPKHAGADIKVSPDGRFVYAAMRGPDKYAVYSVNPGTGRLTNVGFDPVGGIRPRDFIIDPSGKFFFSVNEGTDSISVAGVDSNTGRLTILGDVVRIGTPFCLIFK
jgi:6-phosphogluconolactonase (cycloisomerase 2 family)